MTPSTLTNGVLWSGFRPHAPNDTQVVPLDALRPSEENVRRFVDRTKLETLVEIYALYADGEEVVLPDAPIVRFHDWLPNGDPDLEIIAGERRCTAAALAGLTTLTVRVVTMSDEDSYKFALAHNDVAGLTTAELAYRAAEMDRLGFTHDEIKTALKGISPSRFLDVGRLIPDDAFTDEPKLCDPSIVQWHEAACHGATHFRRCFEAWNAGLWDETTCAREFRRAGQALPLDSAERGFRITYDLNRLVVRGRLDVKLLTPDAALAVLDATITELTVARERLFWDDHFGPRTIVKLDPTTVDG